MPRGIKNKKENNLNKTLDTMENINFNEESIDSASNLLKDVVVNAISNEASPAAKNKISDLKTKYPSRALDDLRKIDFVNQYESKFPKIDRPGYITAWICDTPFKNNRDIYYAQGYDYIEGVAPVSSGYSDITGEDRYAHFAMQIPIEIYNKKQKTIQDLNQKMYGHILKPSKEGKRIMGDGMYDPMGREVKTVSKVITPDQQ